MAELQRAYSIINDLTTGFWSRGIVKKCSGENKFVLGILPFALFVFSGYCVDHFKAISFSN